VDRRAFLRLSALGGASLGASSWLGCRNGGAIVTPPSALGPRDDLLTLTAYDVAEARSSARVLVEAYLARIEALSMKGPKLRAVIENNPDALAIADAMDAERRSGKVRGLLHGVPVLVKDNLDTADRMSTTAGSLALLGSKPARDSFVVRKLRAAGAVLLGKANLSEWANIRSSSSTSGWSARGGLCRNPHVLDRSASGSSSGSASAIAAGLATIAIGTETDGSILSPSSTCGIVGIKPTVGLVSRAGIIPIAHSQDTAGPMTRTVADAALLLSAIAGSDPDDPATAEASQHVVDYTKSLDANGLKGARIGVARKYWGTNARLDAVMESALGVLRDRGATLVDPVDLSYAKGLDDPELEVLLYELKTDLEKYFAACASCPVKTLADVVAFDAKNAAREMPFFGQDIFEKAAAKGSLESPDYLAALDKCRKLSRAEGLDALFAQHQLDAIVAPTGQPAWTLDTFNGDHFTMSSTTPAAVAGYPSITVPAGFVGPLPVGLSFFGLAWCEAKLIRLAFAFEQATHARQPPRFLPTAEMS
jgi:amidase